MAIPESDAQAAVQDVAAATVLLREAHGRIREGSIRLNITEVRARDLVRAGDRAGARKLREDLLAVELVPLYRQQVEIELKGLGD
ncbi:DUF2379 family protein [Corallococcus sp. BB11-1]|uniref:DUSAM domain-containing protein n=1 Tax=Corallococcus sp. BB11-1 TaxID=2996783 RepID=UPI00226D5670|nr:DUF2379 family protein [Corallococcus sp. BB11-1]MCY1032352.1 DUF2379 family protein [Corallococcus sp. BB11-1]